MMKNDLSVGDRVRLLHHYFGGVTAGCMGTVEKINQSSLFFYDIFVRWDSGHVIWVGRYDIEPISALELMAAALKRTK